MTTATHSDCQGCEHLHDALKLALTPQRQVAGWVVAAFLGGAIFWQLFGPGILRAMKP